MMTNAADCAPGMRVEIRGEEWLVKKIETNTLGNQALYCVGVSELVKDRESIFLADLDTVIPVDPNKTKLVADASPNFRNARLYLESQLRRKIPTGSSLYIGHHAAMNPLPYQLEPAYQALQKPRQRILIADTVGLGKTLEAGILMSELIARGKGKRILVVTTKSMLSQFQQEMWNRFTIPLVRLDSGKIKRIRQNLPSNANPFYYYDKTIVSVDTIKQTSEYGVHLENAYWDIIVIDEAQNVAERGTKSVARSRLAKRLSQRSDTLIMLSATPHDGKSKSFASLMNMLDPTAIADPENYTKEDIEGLFVRRFKQDIKGNFIERNVQIVRCKASAQEERAFDIFGDMTLKMDAQKKSGTGQLFKTTIEKGIFSSPIASIDSINHRLVSLAEKDPMDLTGDAAQLIELKEALEQIGPKNFSRYQGLVSLLMDTEYGWDPNDPADRVVIFTERIATKNFIHKQLKQDLKLPKDAIASMDGSLSDTEQMNIIDEFNREASPVRILVASDVASEGINLHHFSHRLIHFDTPWSLMVFQQRNGRIDRYGQTKRPEIRFLIVETMSEQIKGDARILEVLIQKEDQAQKNIGDPSMLMGRFSIQEETRAIEEIIENGASVDELEKATTPSDGNALLEMFLKKAQGEDVAGEVPTLETWTTTLLDNTSYLEEGVKAFGAESGIESIEELSGKNGRRIKLAEGSEIWKRLTVKVLPENNIKDRTIVLSPDRDFCMAEVNRSRQAEFEHGNWPQAQYLWELHPIFEWIGDKSSCKLFARDEAPVIGVNQGLATNESVFLLSGTIPNKKSAPVIDEWVGIKYVDDNFSEFLNLEQLKKLTRINDVSIPNTNAVMDERIDAANDLRSDAVERMRLHLSDKRAEYKQAVGPKVDKELTKLADLQEKHRTIQKSLFLEYGGDKSAKEREIDRIFENYTDWVENTLEIQETSNIKIQAVFVGV